MRAGQAPGEDDRVAIRSEPRPLANPEPILGYVEREENGRRVRTETPKDYPAEVLNDFAATETVVRPLPTCSRPASRDAVATLQRHGIDVQELREDIELDVERYRVEEVGKQASRGWDRQDLLELRVTLATGITARARGHAPGQDGPAAGQPGGLPARASLGGRPGRLEAL